MKLSERMKAVATRQRIRTPAIWTILGDYADEVEQLEAERSKNLVMATEEQGLRYKTQNETSKRIFELEEQLHRVARERDECYRQHRLAEMRRKKK